MIVNTSQGFRRKDKQKVKINLELSTYNIFCRYILQNTVLLRMEHMLNLRKLLNIIDPSTYENDPDKLQRVQFIYKALEARLDNGIHDRDIILEYINGGLSYKVDFLDYNNLDMNSGEIQYIHQLISETIKFSFMYNMVDKFQDICTRFKVSDYQNRAGIVKEFNDAIHEANTEFRRATIDDNTVDMTFSLRDGTFESAVTNTYNIITSPSRRLSTGMQGLNEMLNGGFESGRVYMLLGTAGVGKSLTLLNIIYQIKRYNMNYKTKDPTKTPCICLLTMENTVVETITRLFDLVIENSIGMAHYELSDVLHKLRTEGELVLNDASPIDIVVKYKANKSIDTGYLYTLCDNLEDDNYEVICLVQDHVKRIRSTDNATDIRLELGDIVNEFKVFAAQKDIPVITDSHLNREATKLIEDATKKQAADVGKMLGASNIGESMLMVDNLDCGITIAKEYDRTGQCYMTFNRVKMRDNGSDRNYIAQPFAVGSKIRLVEDVGGIPQFKESVYSPAELKHGNSMYKQGGASSIIAGQNAMLSLTEDDDNVSSGIDANAFDNRHNVTSYNLSETTQIKPLIEANKTTELPVETVKEFDEGLDDLRANLSALNNDQDSNITQLNQNTENDIFSIMDNSERVTCINYLRNTKVLIDENGNINIA